MTPETESRIITLLQDIHDTQRDALKIVKAQQALVKEQLEISRSTVAESLALQRLGLQRQRTVTRIALPAILVCIAAILYLALNYL